MKAACFESITRAYRNLHVVVIGDFCLDRYLEIDPALEERSIETGRPVHNVVRVRALPGGAGTIVNNLAALGVGRISPVGFCGDDGEGFELRRALGQMPGVGLDHFETSADCRTFTYCKPLVVSRNGGPPVELDRLDSKNWDRLPVSLGERLSRAAAWATSEADAVILLEQVEREGTGTLSQPVLETIGRLAAERPGLPILGDSRRGLGGWPPVSFKMNGVELAAMREAVPIANPKVIENLARTLAQSNGRPTFITLSERGILGAEPDGTVHRAPSLPVRGPIDVVGAGDAVTANLAAALAAGATVPQAIELAMAAASIVVHKLGTTGTASIDELAALAVG